MYKFYDDNLFLDYLILIFNYSISILFNILLFFNYFKTIFTNGGRSTKIFHLREGGGERLCDYEYFYKNLILVQQL